MRQVIQHLRAEHDRLLNVITLTEAVATTIAHGASVECSVLCNLTEFFLLYAHGVHREKEEGLLYPIVKQNTHQQSGAGCVSAMMAEHHESEEAFIAMERAAELSTRQTEESQQAWARAAKIYCAYLRNHIRHENDVVFALADRSLNDSDDQQLATEFAKIDDKAERSGIVERLQAAEARAKAATV
jgi:hemerythrin-like domain-containing protein